MRRESSDAPHQSRPQASPPPRGGDQRKVRGVVHATVLPHGRFCRCAYKSHRRGVRLVFVQRMKLHADTAVQVEPEVARVRAEYLPQFLFENVEVVLEEQPRLLGICGRARLELLREERVSDPRRSVKDSVLDFGAASRMNRLKRELVSADHEPLPLRANTGPSCRTRVALSACESCLAALQFPGALVSRHVDPRTGGHCTHRPHARHCLCTEAEYRVVRLSASARLGEPCRQAFWCPFHLAATTLILGLRLRARSAARRGRRPAPLRGDRPSSRCAPRALSRLRTS